MQGVSEKRNEGEEMMEAACKAFLKSATKVRLWRCILVFVGCVVLGFLLTTTVFLNERFPDVVSAVSRGKSSAEGTDRGSGRRLEGDEVQGLQVGQVERSSGDFAAAVAVVAAAPRVAGRKDARRAPAAAPPAGPQREGSTALDARGLSDPEAAEGGEESEIEGDQDRLQQAVGNGTRRSADAELVRQGHQLGRRSNSSFEDGVLAAAPTIVAVAPRGGVAPPMARRKEVSVAPVAAREGVDLAPVAGRRGASSVPVAPPDAGRKEVAREEVSLAPVAAREGVDLAPVAPPVARRKEVRLAPVAAREGVDLAPVAGRGEGSTDPDAEDEAQNEEGDDNQEELEDEVDLLQAFQNGTRSVNTVVDFARWDYRVGCRSFRQKHSRAIRSSARRSLQNPNVDSCQVLRKQHVSVLVKEWTWIPDTLNNLYSCECGLTCLWTNSDVFEDEPDAHVYESFAPPDEKRRKGEPFRVYMDLEPGRNRAPSQDLFVSYHAKDDLQVTYAGAFFHPIRSYYISPLKHDNALLYWSSSRCLYSRQRIATQLLGFLPHHSFGKCLNNVGGSNMELQMYPECAQGSGAGKTWSQNLHCVMSHYKFVLAIENTRTESYVTEKLFYALDAGSVPIYFGAPNVLDFVPPNSIIEGYKFTSMRKLAEYVKKVANDPVLYAEFHAWRRCGVMGPYGRTRAVSLDSLPCRLCTAVSKLGGRNA